MEKIFRKKNLKYKILTEDTVSKTGTVSVSQNSEDCKDCIGITLNIPSSIEHNGIIYIIIQIESKAFSGSTSLMNLTIPESVTSIGWSAFKGCVCLTSIHVEKSNNNYISVDNVLFTKDMATLVAYPLGKRDEKYTIPEGVTCIGDYAFSGCTSLVSIMIPEGVTHVNNGTFERCLNLSSITIPKSVTWIGWRVFGRCESLTSIHVEEGNANYISVDGVLFTKDMTSLIAYPLGKKDENYTIPENVTCIGDSAFSGCTSLVSLMIPEGVTKIDNGAFERCLNLASVTIPKSVTRIGNEAFSICTSLLSITIPEGVASIGCGAFSSCLSLVSITIPERVTRISDYAFYCCKSLTSITIPENVTSIGEWAFGDCEKLTDVYFKGPPPEMDDDAFEKGTIFHYIKGTPGWTPRRWNGFKTRIFDPASS